MKLAIFLIFGLCLCIVSCDKNNPRTIHQWIASSDTLLNKQIIQNQRMYDSLCMVHKADYYKQAYDSIYAKRAEEMKRLLDSIDLR